MPIAAWERGQVRTWRAQGYGFVIADGDAESVFVHCSSLPPDRVELRPGQLIEFQREQTPRRVARDRRAPREGDAMTTETTTEPTTQPTSETAPPPEPTPSPEWGLPWPLVPDSLEQVQVPPEYDGKMMTALADYLQAGLELDRRFSAPARKREVDGEMDAFLAAGRVQGIQTMPEAAIDAKRREVARTQTEKNHAAVAEYEAGRLVVAKMITDAINAAVDVGSHAQTLPTTASRQEKLLAHLVDMTEAEQVEKWKATATFPEWLARYEATPDGTHRAFLAAVERGEVPPMQDPKRDTDAWRRLKARINARQALRIPPEVRLAAQAFIDATTRSRATQAHLIRKGHLD